MQITGRINSYVYQTTTGQIEKNATALETLNIRHGIDKEELATEESKEKCLSLSNKGQRRQCSAGKRKQRVIFSV